MTRGGIWNSYCGRPGRQPDDRRWAATALRGGPIGEQADRDLDAVIAMFEAAGTFTDNLPTAGPAAFVHYLTQLQIPGDSRTRVTAESVAVISAHAAVGPRMEVVAVAGVADGLWPSLRKGVPEPPGRSSTCSTACTPTPSTPWPAGRWRWPTNAGCCWWHVAGRGAPDDLGRRRRRHVDAVPVPAGDRRFTRSR